MKVGLGLGANIGDRLFQLQQAKQYLLSLATERWQRASPVYETTPVNCPAGAPAFFNAVVEIELAGTPRALLRKILAYETAHGRDRTAGLNTPRPIDIDILYFGDREVVAPDLIIPHPRLMERRFVLVPLATICPELVIPGTGRTVQMLLRELPDGAEQVKLVQQDW